MIHRRSPSESLWFSIGVVLTLIVVATLPNEAVSDVADDERRVIEPRGDLAPYEQVNIDLFERISPSVAYIWVHLHDVDFKSR